MKPLRPAEVTSTRLFRAALTANACLEAEVEGLTEAISTASPRGARARGIAAVKKVRDDYD